MLSRSFRLFPVSAKVRKEDLDARIKTIDEEFKTLFPQLIRSRDMYYDRHISIEDEWLVVTFQQKEMPQRSFPNMDANSTHVRKLHQESAVISLAASATQKKIYAVEAAIEDQEFNSEILISPDETSLRKLIRKASGRSIRWAFEESQLNFDIPEIPRDVQYPGEKVATFNVKSVSSDFAEVYQITIDEIPEHLRLPTRRNSLEFQFPTEGNSLQFGRSLYDACYRGSRFSFLCCVYFDPLKSNVTRLVPVLDTKAGV